MLRGTEEELSILVFTRICDSLGYATLGLGLTSYGTNFSPNPKPDVAIARFVWSPNPKVAYPSESHIRVNTSTAFRGPRGSHHPILQRSGEDFLI